MPLLIHTATATEKPHIVAQRLTTVRQQRDSNDEGDRQGTACNERRFDDPCSHITKQLIEHRGELAVEVA